MPTPTRIWFITDEKPGHKNQLKGLAQSLQKSSTIECFWIAISELDIHWSQLIDKKRLRDVQNQITKLTALTPGILPSEVSKRPDLIIGAGHGTHKAVLALKKLYTSLAVVLMKPSLPYRLFDALIIPQHDNPPANKKIFVSKGVLNAIQPISTKATDSRHGLILIGGESKHYSWTNTAIIEQIIERIAHSEKTWNISDSRRTPSELVNQLIARLTTEHLTTRVNIYHHTETSDAWLTQQLQACSEVWVTPDSVSMIYESLTSGRPTGIFSLPPQKMGRVVRGIEKLVEGERLTTWQQWQHNGKLNETDETFCEADRAAQWLINHFNDLFSNLR